MNLAVLSKTDEYVDYEASDIREQIEDIIDDPNNIIFEQFKDSDEMYTIISRHLQTPTVNVTIANIYETYNTIIAAYFIDYSEYVDNTSNENMDENEMKERLDKYITKNKDNGNKKKIKADLNDFGVQITSHSVSDKVIFVKHRLSYEMDGNKVKTIINADNLSQHELLNMLESLFIKNGIVVSDNGEIKSYKYITNPIDHLIKTDANYQTNYEYHEYEIYTHVLMVFMDTRKNKENGGLNIKATQLCHRPVYGTVFVGMYRKPEFTEDPPYQSLSEKQFNHILSIRGKNESLTTNFQRTEKEYVNFDKILESEALTHSDKINLPLDQIIQKYEKQLVGQLS